MSREGQQKAIKVHVAAFGKHPGWDDHIEEIGLDCDALVQVKRSLYTEGVAGNIDNGAWEKLSDEHRLPGFRHVFYWRRPDGFVVGRMWSSRDGRGRTKYPMVVTAMIEGVSQAWVIEHALPRLEAIESKVSQTGSAELVRLAIGEARRGLEDEAALLVAGSPSTNIPGPAALIKALVSSPALSLPTSDGKGMGLTRIMYEMERELGSFRSSGGGTRGLNRAGPDTTPQHLRVPRCLETGGEAASAWIELLSQDIADNVSILIIEPLDEEFLDIVVGTVKPQVLFCVRASAKGLALTSDVPYTIEPAFAQAALDRQEAWANGKIRAQQAPQSAAAGALQAVTDVGSKKGMLLAIGVGALLVIVIVIYVISGGSPKKGEATRDGATNSTGTTGEGAKLDTNKAAIPGSDASKPDASKPEATKATKPGEPEKVSTAPNSAPNPAPPADVSKDVVPKKPEPPAQTYAEGDIRAGWVFDAAATAIKAKLDRLEGELKIEGRAPDASLRETISRAEERATKFVKSATLTPTNRDSVQRDMEACEAALVQVSKEADAKLAEVFARVGAELKTKAETPTVTTEPMRKAWAQGVRAVDPTLGYKAAREKAATLTRQLQETEGKVVAASAVKVPALPDADAGAIDAVMASRRDATLQAAAEAVLGGDALRVSSVVDGYVKYQEEAQGLLDGAQRLEVRIAAGELPSEGPMMLAMVTELQASPAWKDLGGPLGAVVARVNAVAALANESAPEKLLETIHQGKADATRLRASEVLGAWLRLAQIGWPQTAGDLPLAGKALSTEVRETLGRVTAEQAKARALAKADDAARKMWTTFVVKKGVDEQTVGAAIDAMPLLGATAQDVATLPGWAQYNLARLRLERAVVAAGQKAGAERADAQAAAIDAFTASVHGLDVAKTGSAAGLLAAIEPLRSKGAQLDLSKLGPGSAGWKLTQSADGLTASYSWSRGGNEYRLDFKRLAEGATGEVSFVATTEVSLGQFADIVSAAARWEEFRDLLIKSSEGGVDPRLGARAWVWAGETAQGITPCKAAFGDTSGGWVRISSTMQQKQYYPDGLTVAPPSGSSPMQYVGPAPALLVARLVGCRFPTSGEWKQALAADGATPKPNLRDATWKRAVEHLKQFAAMNPQWPASRIFLPAGQKPVPAAQDDQPAVTTDDGVLWFRPVDESTTSTFHDLIGNVAEYVFEEAGALEGVAPARDKVEAALGKGEKLKVIGGSALS
ncbi:MAG: hypothetical protein WC718_11125, partial [Phycisphaerales bacterium]